VRSVEQTLAPDSGCQTPVGTFKVKTYKLHKKTKHKKPLFAAAAQNKPNFTCRLDIIFVQSLKNVLTERHTTPFASAIGLQTMTKRSRSKEGEKISVCILPVKKSTSADDCGYRPCMLYGIVAMHTEIKIVLVNK